MEGIAVVSGWLLIGFLIGSNTSHGNFSDSSWLPFKLVNSAIWVTSSVDHLSAVEDVDTRLGVDVTYSNDCDGFLVGGLVVVKIGHSVAYVNVTNSGNKFVAVVEICVFMRLLFLIGDGSNSSHGKISENSGSLSCVVVIITEVKNN